ncbi:MFS general substrate transporter [Sparassis latifolia]
MSVTHQDTTSVEEKAAGAFQTATFLVEPLHGERRLVRRLDARIMPIVCLLYLFAYLDRTNLGNARLQGLPGDALNGDPTGVLFEWVNSVFFFSYIIFQIPATITSKLFPPRIWLGCSALGWGLCSTLSACGFNFAGLTVARIGLGMFEAGFGPGIPLYMSFYYTKQEIGMRLAYLFGFGAVAGACGGLIAFGVQNAHTALANWRLLFIIEGLPTIFLGVLCLFLLPDRPEETTFLNERERELAMERVNRGIKADIGRTIKKKHIAAAFLDWKIYAAGVIYFGANCALASISAFLPTIITTFGYSNALAQLLTVPPYAVAAIILCSTSYCSDRLQSRGFSVVAASMLGVLGYVLLLAVPYNDHVRYFATFCIISGTYTIIGVVIAWFTHNLGSETKKATGIPMYIAIGQCGSVLGSHLFPTTDGPRFITGFAVSCALEFVSAVTAIILTMYYRMENKRRDGKFGKPIRDAMAPDFRYVP